MKAHVQNVCKVSYAKLRNSARLRNFIPDEAAATMVHAFVVSRLDYCNSLLIGLPDTLIHKLQRVQNCAARVVGRTRKSDHVTPIFQKLHWLPVKYRIVFKILLLAYKAHIKNGLASSYINELL